MPDKAFDLRLPSHSRIRSKLSRASIKLLFWFLLLNLIASVVCGIFSIQTRYFNPDEFQHTHIIWNIVQGKIIYRDFFEHHGPLFPLLNGFFFKLFGYQPAPETFYYLRLHSFVWIILILLLTFLITRLLTQSALWGMLAASLLSALYYFIKEAMEIRPDGLQNALSLLGVYLFLRHRDKPDGKLLFFSGASMAGSMLTNAKAGSFVAGLVICLLVDAVIQKRLGALLRELLLFCGGFLPPFAVLLLYFLRHDALASYFYYNFVFNFLALPYAGGPPLLTEHILFRQLSLHFILIAGLLGLLHSVWIMLTSGRYNSGAMLMALLIPLAIAQLFLHFWWQIFISVLPVLCMGAVFGLHHLCVHSRIAAKAPDMAIAGRAFVLAIFAQSLFHTMQKAPPAYQSGHLPEQLTEVSYTLKNTPRSEPILFIWCNGGGYVFNEDVQYYWVSSFNYLFREKEQRDVWGTDQIDLIEKERVRYVVVSNDSYGMKYLPEVLKEYVLTHFRQTQFDFLRERIEP